jgi:hypothetical protein
MGAACLKYASKTSLKADFSPLNEVLKRLNDLLCPEQELLEF